MRFRSSATVLVLTLFSSALAADNCARTITSQESESPAAVEDIPTVAFCAMVKNPARYFDQRVRLTAIFEQATEGQYLSDEECVLSHDEQIGVGAVALAGRESDLRDQAFARIRSLQYDGRARVTVVGLLRNSSRRAFAWYHYRFDVIRFEGISPVVVPYEGVLQAGIIYRAALQINSFGLSPVITLRVAEYQAVRLEWINLRQFPELVRRRDDRPRQIVFKVISDSVRQMTARRWNRTLHCKVIMIE